jgi:hypothetical protein
MKSFTLAGRATTKTGCRWSGQFSIFSRFRSHPASTHSLHSGGFISRPLRLTTRATGIVRSQSFGGGPTGVFTLLLVRSQTAGWMTDHRSRFVRSLGLPLSSSHSFSDSWLRHPSMRTPTANHALQRTRPLRSGCNRCVPWAGSLSLSR